MRCIGDEIAVYVEQEHTERVMSLDNLITNMEIRRERLLRDVDRLDDELARAKLVKADPENWRGGTLESKRGRY